MPISTCHHFTSGYCRSCSLLARNVQYPALTAEKELGFRNALLPVANVDTTFETIISPISPFASRAKLKAAVSGTSLHPTLGLIEAEFRGKDLLDCPLHLPILNEILVFVREQIQTLKLSPYDIRSQSGELKQVILTTNANQTEVILRFVLRSTLLIDVVTEAASLVRQRFSQVKVTSVNIQPLHAAILEGPEEIVLSEHSLIWEEYNGISVAFGPQSFIQVTPTVAEQLYETARVHLNEIKPKFFLDLFCGSGAFSLVAHKTFVRHLGIEISTNAIDCAKEGAIRNQSSHCEFRAGEVLSMLNNWDDSEKPDVILVNPPRRGLGKEICASLAALEPQTILYSSCNPTTLVNDIELLSGSYVLKNAKPFDMFPLTEHVEGFCVLVRR